MAPSGWASSRWEAANPGPPPRFLVCQSGRGQIGDMEPTDPEVLRRQVAIYRAMGPARKLELAWMLYLSAAELRAAAEASAEWPTLRSPNSGRVRSPDVPA